MRPLLVSLHSDDEDSSTKVERVKAAVSDIRKTQAFTERQVHDVTNIMSRLEVKHDDTNRKTKDISSKMVPQTARNKLKIVETKQKSNFEELQTLTARLNDTTNTTEVLRRDVAALQLSNSDGNKLRQKLSELEAKLQQEQIEREKLAKLIEEEKQERKKGDDELCADIVTETAARRQDLRVVRSKQTILQLKAEVLQQPDAIHIGKKYNCTNINYGSGINRHQQRWKTDFIS